MKFGLLFVNTGAFVQPEGIRGLASAAEAAGIESLWTVEHVLVPVGYRSRYPYSKTGRMPGTEDMPIPDPLVWLGYAAAVTTTLKLATGVLILPQRQPAYVAKQFATLDVLSGVGRSPGGGRLARGGVRLGRRSVRGTRRPHRREHPGPAQPVVSPRGAVPGPLLPVGGGRVPTRAPSSPGDPDRGRWP